MSTTSLSSMPMSPTSSVTTVETGNVSSSNNNNNNKMSANTAANNNKKLQLGSTEEEPTTPKYKPPLSPHQQHLQLTSTRSSMLEYSPKHSRAPSAFHIQGGQSMPQPNRGGGGADYNNNNTMREPNSPGSTRSDFTGMGSSSSNATNRMRNTTSLRGGPQLMRDMLGSPTRKVKTAFKATHSSSSAVKSPTPAASSRGTPRSRIKFCDPFPVLKPPTPVRPRKDIIADHWTGVPTEPIRWVRPRTDLKQLIVAAMGSSLHRRSNACGALKVLLQNSKKNQLTMVRTDSFLACLVFAAKQPISTNLKYKDKETAMDARTRAMACISAVCEPKENRATVLMYPGMVECFTTVIDPTNIKHRPKPPKSDSQDDDEDDDDDDDDDDDEEEDLGAEARALACGACALIAKSLECREAMAAEERLIILLAQVLGGGQQQNVPQAMPPPPPHENSNPSAQQQQQLQQKQRRLRKTDGSGKRGSKKKKGGKRSTPTTTPSTNTSAAGTTGANTTGATEESKQQDEAKNHSEDVDPKESTDSSHYYVSGEEEDDDDDDDEEDEDYDDDSAYEDQPNSYEDFEEDEGDEDHDDDDDDDEEEEGDSYDEMEEGEQDGSKSTKKGTATTTTTPKKKKRGGLELSAAPSSGARLVSNPSIRKISREKSLEFYERARSNSCAVFLHLSKHCPTADRLCSNKFVLHNVLLVANERSNPIHTKCLEILLNFSRFPANNGILADFQGMVPSLMDLGESSDIKEDRVSALRCLQNISTDPKSKLKLATERLLIFVTACSMRPEESEKEAAVSTLYNLTTEPGAVVAITNTKNAVATLVHLAHHPASPTAVRLRSSEALATIALWLQTLAGTGKVPHGENPMLPTQRTTGWERWD